MDFGWRWRDRRTGDVGDFTDKATAVYLAVEMAANGQDVSVEGVSVTGKVLKSMLIRVYTDEYDEKHAAERLVF
jgi:hypothetical protein